MVALESPRLINMQTFWGKRSIGRTSFQPILRKNTSIVRNHILETMQMPVGTYIISGGLGALGLLVGKSVAFSAGDNEVELILIGRSSTLLTQVPEFTSALIRTTIIKAELALKADALALCCPENQRCIQRIHHAAGVLRDGSIPNQTLKNLKESFASKQFSVAALVSMAAKGAIAQNIFYGSIASSLGSAGQLPYAMDNASLDALATKLTAKVGQFLSV